MTDPNPVVLPPTAPPQGTVADQANDQVMSAIRAGLMGFGAVFVTAGSVSSSQLNMYVGAAMAVISFVWGQWNAYRKNQSRIPLAQQHQAIGAARQAAAMQQPIVVKPGTPVPAQPVK